jgi:hypothetical protein
MGAPSPLPPPCNTLSKAVEMVDATIALFATYHVNRTAAKLTLPLSA